MREERRSQPARVAQREVGALYDRLAPLYDVWGRLTESRARDRALELARIQPGERVLEVAVGTGLLFVDVVRANPGGRNVGIDLSPGMLAKAERRLLNAGLTGYELSVGDATDLGAADGAFDLLLNNYMFDLLDEAVWDRVLGGFRRALRPGGRLVVVNMTLGERLGSGLYERLYTLSPALMGGCRGVRLSGPLSRNGFAVEHREYHQQMLFPSEVILAGRAGDQQAAEAGHGGSAG